MQISRNIVHEPESNN